MSLSAVSDIPQQGRAQKGVAKMLLSWLEVLVVRLN